MGKRRAKHLVTTEGAKPFLRAPEHLVAVDPGVTKCGLAYFYRGELREATTLHTPTVEAALGWVLEVCPQAAAAATWVRERMYYYPTRTATHANLDKVEDWADDLAEAAGVRWSRAWTAPTWKGPIKKSPHHRRLRTALTGAEVWVWTSPSIGEDGRDAVGIGLYALNRVRAGGLPRVAQPSEPTEPADQEPE